MFPFGKAIAPPPTPRPLLGNGVRPGGSPIAPRALSVLIIVLAPPGAPASSAFRSAAPTPAAAPPQDSILIHEYDNTEPIALGVPPGGKEEGMK